MEHFSAIWRSDVVSVLIVSHHQWELYLVNNIYMHWMSETPELTVLALTAIQRETFVVLWLFKMCTKVCFFPSVALARSYQDFNELSAKKTCWPSSKRVNWTSILSVIYLSKRFFYHYYEIIIGVYLLGCLWDAKSIWKIRIALMDPCFS